jgi:hydroxyacylglutathione hydrolase
VTENLISITSIPQLKDNYCYIMTGNKNTVIIDPAESASVLNYTAKKKLNIIAILLTHHHHDHTDGVNNILKYKNIPVYSPDKKIEHTTNVVTNGCIIKLNFINMEVIKSPGHTLDHIIYYNKIHKILFSGDTLFRLGCGRVFEGTYKQMQNSLIKIKSLDNATQVYCGHEYTLANLNFLLSIFPKYKDLIDEKKIIKEQLRKKNTSMPFNLGREKSINPFLSSESQFYSKFKNQNNFSDIQMFSYLRDLKNIF